MEALGGLAVAERDIRALGTARADSCPLSASAHCVRRKTRFARLPSPGSLRSPGRRDPASPFQSARIISCWVGYRNFNVETACVTRFFLVD